MPPSRISSDEGVVGEWRAVGVKQMVVVAEKATRGGEFWSHVAGQYVTFGISMMDPLGTKHFCSSCIMYCQ